MVVPKQPEQGSKQADDASALAGVDATRSLDAARGVADAAGKTVVAAALAGAVATGAAAVTPDQIHLPEPTPIVQTVDQGVDQPDSTTDDHAEKKSTAVKRLLQILKYALLALFFAAAFIFGVLQGCASCSGSLAAPFLTSSESSQEAASSSDASSQAAVSSEASSQAASSSEAYSSQDTDSSNESASSQDAA